MMVGQVTEGELVPGRLSRLKVMLNLLFRSIVNIASQLGIVARSTARELKFSVNQYYQPNREKAAYCSAKAAIINLTKADAIDVSRAYLCLISQ